MFCLSRGKIEIFYRRENKNPRREIISYTRERMLPCPAELPLLSRFSRGIFYLSIPTDNLFLLYALA